MKTLYLSIVVCLLCAATFTSQIASESLSLKDIEKSMVLIPKGSVNCCKMGDAGQMFSPSYKLQNVDSFYICSREVSNGDYLKFLADIYRQDIALYHKMLPDTQVWKIIDQPFDDVSKPNGFITSYFRSPAFSNFPLVGITHEQATAYCDWLTKTYMAAPKRKYGKVKFALPTLAQWSYAAGPSRTFPVGEKLQNDKSQWLANFMVFDQASIKRNTDSAKEKQPYMADQSYVHKKTTKLSCSSDAFITVIVDSYWPDVNGLHNMAGNVEEYVREKGFTKGGSWKDPGYYLQNVVEETYDSTSYTSAERGFRYVMEIVK